MHVSVKIETVKTEESFFGLFSKRILNLFKIKLFIRKVGRVVRVLVDEGSKLE
jgi:hypothetical protein